MVGGGGTTGIVGVSFETFHGTVCGREHRVLDMVEKDGDGLEISFTKIGAEETIAN